MEPVPEAGVIGCSGHSENLLSVNMNGLKPRRVVEVHIMRSLSLREADLRGKELKWRSLPTKMPQGSLSRPEGAGLRESGTVGRKSERKQAETESLTHRNDGLPPINNSLSTDTAVVKEAGKERNKDAKRGRRSQTFFGKITSLLWRKKGDEKKEDGCTKSKELGAPQAEHTPEENGEQLLSESQRTPGDQQINPHKTKVRRKSSLRRVFSFKKNNSEVKEFGWGGPGASKVKAEHPKQLALKAVCRPRLNKTARDSESVYEQVSEEVDRIVQTLESSGDKEKCLKETHAVEELETDGPRQSVDNSISKIITILQNVGDRVDTELQGDVLLSTFFQTISYNSFKELADQYIQTEVRSKVTQENPDLVKFAFTLDFTAKVAGLCTHQIKQITGFGSQYLRETCWHLPSFSVQETANNTEKIPSPD
ncbi:uncharacterized protein LOC132828241 isoform X2 [Hemiscyllium ocellatum]|uniref:uncharacterized protein LOC132828241 isoform X2 n=1 Tax=Hemiscyllium ocellatum TaxID=170820 RepID=UPI00296735A4|nr:uncharacterized protein LOC132828241 isoform X2 [Hemiscyllium ocellatum]